METVYCIICNKQLRIYRYRLKKTKSFYCAECYKTERKKILAKYIAVGQKAATNKIKKNGLTEKQLAGLAKGRHKEKHHKEETKTYIKLHHKGKHFNPNTEFDKEEKHYRWMGDKVGYDGLHRWVAKKLGKPKTCEHCRKSYPLNYLEWANKSHTYKRQVDDWLRLCRKCHKQYDATK